MKKLVAAWLALCIGCASQPKFLEGTLVQIGAYVPQQSNLYGVEIMSYVSGCVVRTPTNMCYEVQRNHCATNSWLWGMLEQVEYSDTKVKLK